MKIEIINKKQNPLLNREEVNFIVSYTGGVPEIASVRKELITTLKSDEKFTIVDRIKPEFGRSAAKGYVKIYGDADSMNVEPEHRIKKNFETKEADG